MVGALGAIMKGLAEITETNNEIMKSLKELRKTETVSKSVVEITDNKIVSSVEETKEDIFKSAPIAEPTPEGKAVDFVQKSVEPIDNIVENDVAEESEIIEKSLGEQAYDLRKSFMPAFQQATSSGATRSELFGARNAWNSLGAGGGSEQDLKVIKSFIEKYK